MAREQIVIIGAGQAGAWAAMTLRKEGFSGSVLLVGDEPHLPYERPPLSKAVLAGTAAPETTRIFAEKNYAGKDIEHIVARVKSVALAEKKVFLENGARIGFDRLIIATGCRKRTLSCPGSHLGGIHYLRTLEDSLSLQQDLRKASSFLVVGGGWIGLEAAATARSMGVEVTVVEAGSQLCARSLHPEASRYLEAIHRREGVAIRLQTTVEAFQGGAGVEKVQLKDGTTVNADCVLIGIGVTPNDEIARQAGLEVYDGILVDEFARASAPDVYAAGDVARQPNKHFGGWLRLEAWENAQNQAVYAAKSALGLAHAQYQGIPWMWSDQYEMNIQIIGFTPHATDRLVTAGDPETGEFLMAFFREEQLWGAIGFNRGREIKVLRKLMEVDYPVSEEDLNLPAREMMKLARQAG